MDFVFELRQSLSRVLRMHWRTAIIFLRAF